ncbi:MAG: phosphatidylcholine/phosphatidylserine synthase [Phycisphaerales bacterium]
MPERMHEMMPDHEDHSDAMTNGASEATRAARDGRVPMRIVIPNVITTAALCAGLASMHFAIKATFASPPDTSMLAANWNKALLAVAFAALFDALDGRTARLLHGESRFGVVLDSLSDFVAFGVAPAMMLYLWLAKNPETLKQDAHVTAAVMTFALCSALRLARFTAAANEPAGGDDEPEDSAGRRDLPPALAKKFFTGMPTPAAAGCVLIPVMLKQSRTIDFETKESWVSWVVAGFTLLIAWLMISRVPMFSFKKMRLRKGWIAPLLAAIGLILGLIVRDPWLALAAIAGTYLLTLPLSVWTHRKLFVMSGAA